MFLPKFSKFPSTALLCLVLVLLQFQFQFLLSHPCLPQESAALLHFKSLFSVKPYGSYLCDKSYPKTETWKKDNDCCNSWAGVTCDGADGHVTGLDLRCCRLRPAVPFNSTSVLGLHLLPRLRNLNLALNDFIDSQMPAEITRLPGLKYLNLTYTDLSFQVNPDFSLLSNLVVLDLSMNGFLKFDTTGFKTLATKLTKLEVLVLSGSDFSMVNLASPINFTRSIRSLWIDDALLHGRLHEETFRNLQNLERLSLAYNSGLEGSFPRLNWSRSLEILDLSMTNLYGLLPKSVGALSKLRILNLGGCNLSGSVPPLDSLNELNVLNLGHNCFSGSIPGGIFSLPKLREVHLSNNSLTGQLHEFRSKALEVLNLQDNKLRGSLPGSLFQLVNLTKLRLGSNNFTGTIELSMFLNFQNLLELDLSRNNLTVSMKQVTTNASELRYLDLSSCNLSEFPGFIRNSSYLFYLDLSGNKIKGEVPDWMYEVGRESLEYLSLSHNFLTSFKQIPWDYLIILDLHSNSITGNIPILPYSICNPSHLGIPDLSNESLSDTIPKCLPKTNSLHVLDLGLNKFHGLIPDTFPRGCRLQTVTLRENDLEGPVPQSLVNCTLLDVLDLGKNRLNDTFPSWLAPLPKLEVLVLHSNQFYGYLVSYTTENQFPNLRILDVSNNNFNGPISNNFLKHFKAMTKYIANNSSKIWDGYYQDSVVLTLKGFEYEMERILTIFTTLDLSSNNFQGQIPRLIGDFQALKVLNLSHNNLTGQIPESLGNLTEMETMDLSWNQLVGKIPQQLTSVTSLEVLNLSQNRLVGSIPQGMQFNTFGNDSYIGNFGLCGFPLSKECNRTSEVPTTPHEEDYSSVDDFTWQPVLIGFVGGFIVAVVASYVMFLIGKPQWFIGMVERETNRILKRRSRRHGRRRN